MKLWRLAAHALIAAILGLVVFGGGVATADNCGGFGPGIVGSNNCGSSNNNTGGGRDTVYDSWPPGMDWGWNVDDDTPIVLPAP